ncbi:MAG: M20 metallopeptidase family protein, partial [Halanaerobiales bacterium]
KAEEIKDWVVEIRRDIHRHPEPSQKETRTSKKVAKILKDLGVEVETGYYNTGVAGLIRGKNEGKTLGLRFDMDALEMEEKTELSFSSKNKGVMHACGHDGHTAMGLGVARILMQMRDKLQGNIKLIFQPAEEDAQSGGGAQYMIEEGVLENPQVNAMVGMHIWPKLNLGEIGTKVGTIMAASDPVTIDVIGKGAHASLPNMAVDPVVIGSQIVNNLQTIVSRNVDPFEQAVVTIGIFAGGTRYNTIPESVRLEGTVRTFSEEVRDKVYERIHTIAEKTAEAMGGEVDVNYIKSYPPTVNDEKMVNSVKKSIIELRGRENYVEIDRPASGGEDFAYFSRRVPSVYLWLGYNKEGEEIYPPHSPYFDFDEQALVYGIEAFCKIATDWGEYNVFQN